MPISLVRSYGLARRWAVDRITGRHCLFASPTDQPEVCFESRILLRQNIMRTESYDAKLGNISLAFSKLNNVVVQPGQIFSFWYLVGEPSKGNGYLLSRSLLNGKLVQDYGGGLCQLAGMIYHLSLLAGLKIMERHPHSRDIYQEHERFTPLGSDAAVAYGIKDLSMQNSLPSPIQFCFTIENEQLAGRVCSMYAISERVIAFVRQDDVDSMRTVETYAVAGKSGRKLLANSRYRIGAK